MKLPQYVEEVIERLRLAGFEACVVGGCVRDSLLGRTPTDYDVASSARPEQLKAVFSADRVLETGLRHGTLTVLADRKPVEITTYRVDGAYRDHRHPEGVFFTDDLIRDLSRRDFTVNAMAYIPGKGIVDPFGGQRDLAEKRIRCVADAERRFQEDALRILRALRFSSVLGFEIEEKTADAAKKYKELLGFVSAERVSAELVRLLCGKNVRSVLCGYTDILGVVIPEILPMKGFDQRSPYHHLDVLEHCAAAAEAIAAEPVLRLAALFHDIGKPDCFSLDETGTGHFYGHAARSAEMTQTILNRLKLDRKTAQSVVTLVKEHDLPLEEQQQALKRVLRRLGSDTFFALLQLMRADNAAQPPQFAGRQLHYDRLEQMAGEICRQEACFSLKDLAVDGNDLIRMGMKPGKQIGLALEKMLDAVISEKTVNEKEAILSWYRENL